MLRIPCRVLISVLVLLAGCVKTSPIRLQQGIPGTSLKETLTLFLLDETPLPESRWAAEADRIAVLRKQENRCKDWNNEGVYRALIAARSDSGLSSEALPLLEKAVRLCSSEKVDQNYRAIFYLAGKKTTGSAGP